jgi:hypothetical protein
MGRKVKARIFFLFLVIFFPVWMSNAQPNLVFYNDQQQVNSSLFNPSFLTSQQKFTFSILPLSGMSVGYNNQAVIKDMLFDFISGEQTSEDFRDVFNSLLKRDQFYQRMEFPILTFGHNSELGSFDFRIKEVEQLLSDFKSNFSEFLSNPDYKTIATNQKQLFPAAAIYYREYSLGYGKEIIKHKLDVGIRIKFYFGKANLQSEVEGGIEQNNGKFFLKTSGPARISVPFKLIQNSDSVLTSATMTDNFKMLSYLFNSKNSGIGVDLGFNYQITHQLQLSASITDLGKIRWNNNLSTMNLKGTFELPENYIEESGIDFITKSPVFSTSNDEINLSGLFKIQQEQEDYATMMPPNVYVGMKYQLNPKFSVGAVNRYIGAKTMNFNSLSITVGYDVNKKLTISSGYSILGNSYTNLPFALLYTRETSQSFIGTDNLLSFFVPSLTEFSGITFGTCFFLFKHKSKYKDQLEYRPYFKEKRMRQSNKKGLIFNEYKKDS